MFNFSVVLAGHDRNTNGVNGIPCWYKGVNGVLLVGIKALTAFCLSV